MTSVLWWVLVVWVGLVLCALAWVVRLVLTLPRTRRIGGYQADPSTEPVKNPPRYP